MDSIQILLLGVFLLGCCCLPGLEGTSTTDNVFIRRANMRWIGSNGEVVLVFYGGGFAQEHKPVVGFAGTSGCIGNVVRLVGSTQTYICPTDPQGTTRQQLQCRTPSMMDGDYKVNLCVDGVDVTQLCVNKPDLCIIRVRSYLSGTITSVTPSSGRIGTVINICGSIGDITFEPNSFARLDNENKLTLKRVFLGSVFCDPIDSTSGELLGIAAAEGNEGCIKCTLTGSYVGPANVSAIISGGGGRLRPSGLTYHVDRSTTFMFEFLPEITGISPSVGSKYGGTRLTIDGTNFVKSKLHTQVQIAGTTCTIVTDEDVPDDQIICVTDAKPTSLPTRNPGNRGVTWQCFNTIDENLSKYIDHEANQLVPGDTKVLDSLAAPTDGIGCADEYVYKMTGYFIPQITGPYKFFTEADDKATFYFASSGDFNDLSEFVSNPEGEPTTKYSGSVDLEAEKLYPLVVISRKRTGAGTGKANVGMYSYKSYMPSTVHSSNAIAEEQKITITSTVKNEIQGIELQDWTEQTSTFETQVLRITSSEAEFRLGYLDVFTGLLNEGSAAADVEKELEDLFLIWYGVIDISATRDETAQGIDYTFTFNSDLGDFDMLSVQLLSGSAEMEEQENGRPKMSIFALSVLGSVSGPLSNLSSAEDIQKAILATQSVRCSRPYIAGNEKLGEHLQDYESQQEYHECGTRVNDVEPHCGTTCLKNPSCLYKESEGFSDATVDFFVNKQLCFAYKGYLDRQKAIEIEYVVDGKKEKHHIGMSTTISDSPEAWSFVCFDVFTKLQETHPSAWSWQMKRVLVYKNGTADFFVDTFMVVRTLPERMEAITHRLPPATWSVKDVTVTGTADDFQVELTMRQCAHDLPHITLLGAGTADIDGLIATFDGSNGTSARWAGGATVTTTKVQEASPPVTGTFDLTGIVIDVKANVTGEVLKDKLEEEGSNGRMCVEREGSCAGYSWTLTWRDKPGDQAPVVMDCTNLEGNEPSCEVNTLQHGSQRDNKIRGSTLCTDNQDKPQVRMTMNEMSARCEDDCSFEWEDAVSPECLTATPATGSNQGNTVLTLTGTDFSDVAGDNQVMIGGIDCPVTSYSETQILCTIGKGPAGIHDVMVTVAGKGLAGGSCKFTYEFSVTSMDPIEGSTAGGTNLTISGTGFSEDVDIQVGGNPCEHIKVNYNTIVCSTPEETVGTGKRKRRAVGPVPVLVTNGDVSKTVAASYSFVPGSTVTAIDKPIISVAGGDDITIAGNDFGTGIEVWIGGQIASIVSDTNTNIVGRSPKCSPGSHDITVKDKKGTATSTTSMQIKCELEVNHMFPKSGSILGGTELTLTGKGFPTDTSQISVLLGGKDCPISQLSATELICTTPTTCENIIVDNSGTHTVYGLNFAFNKRSVECVLGCSIRFEWEAPIASNIQYKIEQVNEDSNDAVSGGGTSGQPTPRGIYVHKCTEIGTFHYWSGFVVDEIALRITLTVVDQIGKVVPLQVKYAGYDAPFIPDSGVTDPDAVSSCTTAISGCTDDNVPPAQPGQYAYTVCKTPKVTNVTFPDPTSPDTVKITGTDFSTCTPKVRFGTRNCPESSATDTEIVCNLETGADVGVLDISLIVPNRGLSAVVGAMGVATINLKPKVTNIDPAQGSCMGGTLVAIHGDGFSESVKDLKVIILDKECIVQTPVTSTKIVCKTFEGSGGCDGTKPVYVRKGTMLAECKMTGGECTFTHSDTETPTLSGVIPETTNTVTTEFTLSGTGFGSTADSVSVHLGETQCTVSTVISVTETNTIKASCSVTVHTAADHTVKVNIKEKGTCRPDPSDKTVRVEPPPLSVTSASPGDGSSGRCRVLTVIGEGFHSSNTEVTVCGEPCIIDGTPTSRQLTCIVPAQPPSANDLTCDVEVKVGDRTVPASQKFTYAFTSTITAVQPHRGGTAGNTLITISGSGFGTDANAVTVTIGGSTCVIQTPIEGNKIECLTGPHAGSIKARVEVSVGTTGCAASADDDGHFEYIDIWSSPSTWVGGTLPVDRDFVVITKGQTILLDTDTPVLAMLLIRGGKLIASDEVDLELKAEKILVTDDGSLQVGTEEYPHQHKFTITLYGHLRSKELPIYGSKMLAVRQGTLDLHGIAVDKTWVLLGTTAYAGESKLELLDAVDWPVDAYIVIATTGARHSQNETEKRQIKEIQDNGKTIVLHTPLVYTHLGEHIPLDPKCTGCQGFAMRAEVILLTRNIVVRGSNNEQWNDPIEACAEGFDTGEFTTQTCFQGRFGQDTGSDGFGGHIILCGEKGLGVTVRIEHVEVHDAGQAFRIGRYAIHFHLCGDMSGSYVRACAVHDSHNRAINLHGTHNALIGHNVAYNIMGGAFFLEDGIETGNIITFNVVIFWRASSSLQNDDITPAAFWVTNPNNIVNHNHAAGGTHFGFWYRMHIHPDGPSFDETIWPQHVPLGIFSDNTVHSCGWFGLWIFTSYFPTSPAEFKSLTAWNCEKGAEAVHVENICFIGFCMVNNEKAGIEIKALPKSSYETTTIDGACIVAPPDGPISSSAIIAPQGETLHVTRVVFLNFNKNHNIFTFAKIDGKTGPNNGGYQVKLSELTPLNSTNKFLWRWMHEGVFWDMDGTFIEVEGWGGGKVLPTAPHLPDDQCNHNVPGMSKGIPGSVCQENLNFIRFSFNHVKPESTQGLPLICENQDGKKIRTEYERKRVTHQKGYMCTFLSGDTYKCYFETLEHLTNLSYTGAMYRLEDHDCIRMKHNFAETPDRAGVKPGDVAAKGSGSSSSCNDGDWYLDNNELVFTVSGKGHSRQARDVRHSRHTRDVSSSQPHDSNLAVTAYQCESPDCGEGDSSDPGANKERPKDAIFWHDTDSWPHNEHKIPGELEDVNIRPGKWVVVEKALPPFGKCYIDGTLEFEHGDVDDEVPDHVFNCTHIVIKGRLIMGWEDTPYTGNGQIVLRGNHNSEQLPQTGAKAMGVYGGLDLHGRPCDNSWTRLTATASPGATKVTLEKLTCCRVGDELVFAPTGYSTWETEIRKIESITENNEVTLNEPLSHTHRVETVAIGNGQTKTMAGEVGCLSRNIKIIGHDVGESQGYGFRVLISRLTEEGKIHRGWARISYTEFYNGGQEGYTDPHDPRVSLAFLNLGMVSDERPAYVKSCSFSYSHAGALAISYTDKLSVTGNVFHHSVGSAIIDYGEGNRLVENLVVNTLFTGTYLSRDVGLPTWQAAIDLTHSKLPELTGNVVAGAERAAYHINGEKCGDVTVVWSDNTAHSALLGVMLLKDNGITDCTKIRGFFIYMTFDAAIYIQIKYHIIVESVILVNNRVGIYPMVIGPSSVAHICKHSYVIIRQSEIVATSDNFDCSDTMTSEDRNIFWSGNSRFPGRPGDVNNIAIVIPVFSVSGNKAPDKPFFGMMGYNTICGSTTISEVTFVNFNSKCNNKRDVMIFSAPENDDLQHPVTTGKLALINVDDNTNFLYLLPRIEKVNPADCVDMDCDGFKKLLITDSDGTLTETAETTTATAMAERAWDKPGMEPRGLGDYRIPKTLLSKPDGTRINVTELAPHKGIIRNKHCWYDDKYQAYLCPKLNHKMMAIESLDADTETRRVSPVAILVDGYLDLLNGPQDHGWCNGYTCQKRVSLFHPIVVPGKLVTVHYTGTAPQDSRIRVLGANTNEAFLVAIYYSIPQTLEVYKDGKLVEHQITKPNVEDPNLASGSNYFDMITNLLYVYIRGSEPVDIKMMRDMLTISLGFPPMSYEDFYGTNMINNLALYLKIPQRRIKYATASSRRRKRDTTPFKVVCEFSNPPGTALDPSQQYFSYDKLLSISSTIFDAMQLGTLGKILNLTVLDIEMTEPLPAPGSSVWKTLTVAMDQGQSYTLKVQTPLSLKINTRPAASTEGELLRTQPRLSMVDVQGDLVQQLGSRANPWKVSVSLRSGSTTGTPASLTGHLEAEFIDGYAKFTNLGVSHSGSYKLDFKVTHPSEAANRFSVQSGELVVERRRLAAAITYQHHTVTVDKRFTIQAGIVDEKTGQNVQDIAWQGHTWRASASIYLPEISPGQLEGTRTVTMDADTGEATFDNLKVTAPGAYFVMLSFESTPAQFSFSVLSSVIEAVPLKHNAPENDVTKAVRLRFGVDYNTTLAGMKAAYFSAAVHIKIMDSIDARNVSVGAVSLTEGSVLATFAMGGGESDVASALASLYLIVSDNQFSFTFFGSNISADGNMWVDSQPFYGILALDAPLSAGLLAAIIVSCVIAVIIIVVIIVVLVMNKKGKEKKATAESFASLTGKKGIFSSTFSTPEHTMNFGGVVDGKQGYHQPQWSRSSTNTSSSSPGVTNSPSTIQEQQEQAAAEDFQDINLEYEVETRPTPLPDVPDDDDDVEEGQEALTSRVDSPPGGSRVSSRQSRPPSTPPTVWSTGKK